MSELKDDILSLLTDYCGDVSNQIQSAADRLTKQAQKTLESESPRKTGKYAKSWRLKRFKGKRFRFVIYNDEYRLTHLLENGFTHVPDMKKHEGRPHIDPVQEKLNEDFYSECVKIIEGGV